MEVGVAIALLGQVEEGQPQVLALQLQLHPVHAPLVQDGLHVVRRKAEGGSLARGRVVPLLCAAPGHPGSRGLSRPIHAGRRGAT